MSEPDLSEFEKLSHPKSPVCRVGVAVVDLTPSEREQLEAALATDKEHITNAAIAEWLTRRGHETAYQVVSNHRRGKCSCNRG